MEGVGGLGLSFIVSACTYVAQAVACAHTATIIATDSIVIPPLNTPNLNSDKDIEECDDGNLLMFDGCSDKCLLEAGFSCSPNQTHPTTSNCTGPPAGMNGFKPNYLNVFINFGTPVIVVISMACCCVSILKFYPHLWKRCMPFGLHEKVVH